jgi:hypothetical protein
VRRAAKASPSTFDPARARTLIKREISSMKERKQD